MPRTFPSLQDRFNAAYEVMPSGCWEWRRAHSRKKGYGYIKKDGRSVGAHRVSHELFIGPIPEGFEIDHLCKNTSCVNPDHLEAVPGSINKRRSDAPSGLAFRRTTCAHGHEYTPENTYLWRGTVRICRTCRLEAKIRYRTRLRAEGKPLR